MLGQCSLYCKRSRAGDPVRRRSGSSWWEIWSAWIRTGASVGCWNSGRPVLSPRRSGPAWVRVCGFTASWGRSAGRGAYGRFYCKIKDCSCLSGQICYLISITIPDPAVLSQRVTRRGDSVCSPDMSQSWIGAVCYENSNQMASLCRNQWILLSVPFHF